MTLADAIQAKMLWIQCATVLIQFCALAGLLLYVRYTGHLRDAARKQIDVTSLAVENQRQAVDRQNFDTKYFELIKMHRDNVAEIEVKTVSGRKFFVWLIRELRCALDVIRRVVEASGETVTQREAMHMAYYCVFFGVGPNSSRMLKTSLSGSSAGLIDAIEKEMNKPEAKEAARVERGFPYTPFEGHQSRLGHYYRHLYQMVRYVDQQQLIGIDKYEYVKTMRAQLSTHEQAALLVNSITSMGQDWWRRRDSTSSGNGSVAAEGLIVKYRLVQNIPLDFFDSSKEFDPTKLFGRGYFEWEDSAAGRSIGSPVAPQ